MPELPNPERILSTSLGFWASKTLLSAVELGVFTELAAGAQPLESLRERLGLHPRSARDFLDALVALGFLARTGQTYANSADADLFLDRAKPTYLGGLLEMANRRLYRYWANLTDGLRTGLPQNEIRDGGRPLFDVLYEDPAALREFLSAMTGFSHAANRLIAHRLPWDRFGSFVDVGTAQGDLAVQIARAQPHLRGIGFDLPAVQPIFAEYAKAHGVSERLRFEAGDFFACELPRADVVLMGHVLHDWDLATKRQLIAKAFAAVPPGGALVVYESLIDDERCRNVFGLLMSLNMLIETAGGFDFTGADCASWMADAGFAQIRVEPLIGPDSMVVGIRP
jgi:hypothetical protein